MVQYLGELLVQALPVAVEECLTTPLGSRLRASGHFKTGRHRRGGLEAARTFAVTDPAHALKRARDQMLVRVTALPLRLLWPPRSFASGGSEASGIITAVSYSHAPPPNPSFKRTRLRLAA